jgi:predicted DNA-binding protein (MmcQ/YjbR family)
METDRQKQARLRKICGALPEVVEITTFGQPTFRAGKKSFAGFSKAKGPLAMWFKADPDEHPFLVEQDRVTVARHIGQHGWVVMDLSGELDWDEIEELLTTSYRLAALKRMLKALDAR